MATKKTPGNQRTGSSAAGARSPTRTPRLPPVWKTVVERRKVGGTEIRIRRRRMRTPRERLRAAQRAWFPKRPKLPPLSDPIWDSSEDLKAIRAEMLERRTAKREMKEKHRRERARSKKLRELLAPYSPERKGQAERSSLQEERHIADEVIKILAEFDHPLFPKESLLKCLSSAPKPPDKGGD